MFHSSSSRHEQYLIRTSPSKATLSKKRSSLESEVSGADSGYTSFSSTPSTTPTTHTSAIHHVIDHKSNKTNGDVDVQGGRTSTSSINTDTSATTKKKKSKKHQPPRQPDLVYSSPRPLAFPFHNDDHFLPIAEADPRDVARVSPSLNRSSSMQSSKTSVGSTRMYDSSTTTTYSKGLDAESSYSHQSSILSSIQRGTVRSIRSIFQLPDSLSKTNLLERVQTNNTNHTNYSTHSRCTNDSSTSTIKPQPPLERLEIKKGTVQSIKDIFTMKRSSARVTQPVAPPRQQKGIVGATVGQFESTSNFNGYSRSTFNVAKNNKNQHPPSTFKPVAVNVTKPNGSNSFTSRASEFASRAFWKPKPTTTATALGIHHTPATKPLPKSPSSTKTIKSEVKKLSAKVLALPKTLLGRDEGAIKLPPDPPIVDTNPALPPPPKKKSIFSSFRRADVSVKAADKKKKKQSQTTEDVPLPVPTTTVGKMWKSFKNLVTGKNSSRVGVL